MAGLAQAWSAVTQLSDGSDWPGNVLWIVAAATWLVTLAAYLANIAAQRRWKTELSDPTFGPFTALIVILPMLLGARLAEQARGAGEFVFGCSAVLVVLVGAWISGEWITSDGDIRRWHPGYFLPTAAGGLLAGGASAGGQCLVRASGLFHSLSLLPSPMASTGWPLSTCAAARPSATPLSAFSPPGSCCWRRGRSPARSMAGSCREFRRRYSACRPGACGNKGFVVMQLTANHAAGPSRL